MHYLLLAVDTGKEVRRCGVSSNKLSTSSMYLIYYLMFNVDVTMVMVTMAVAGCPLLWLKDYVKIKLLIELETWKSENQVQREKSRGRGTQQQQYTARGYWGQGKEDMCGEAMWMWMWMCDAVDVFLMYASVAVVRFNKESSARCVPVSAYQPVTSPCQYCQYIYNTPQSSRNMGQLHQPSQHHTTRLLVIVQYCCKSKHDTMGKYYSIYLFNCLS